MKIKTLEYFVTLAESKSINEAAKRLYIAQPSLTKALHLLEEEIGTQLFQRTSTGICLTQAGKKMLPEAKQVLEYYNGWKDMARQSYLEQINICTFSSFSDFLFPDILLKFRRKYPSLRINYSVSTTPDAFISRSTTSPSIVLYVCNDEESRKKLSRIQGSEPTLLMRGDYRCLLSKQSPIAHKKELTLEDLKDLYLVLPQRRGAMEEGNFITSLIRDINNISDKQRMIAVESLSNVIHLVNRDPETYALSYYPALQRYPEVAMESLVHIPLKSRYSNADMYLFYSRQACALHPVLQELVQEICDAVNQFLTTNK